MTGLGRSLLARRLCGPEAAAPPALSCSLVSLQPLPLPRERGTPPGMPAESGRGCWTQRPRLGRKQELRNTGLLEETGGPLQAAQGAGAEPRPEARPPAPTVGALPAASPEASLELAV